MSDGRKYEDKLHIDMPFDEALERFVGVDPAEMQANIDKSKKKKPPGSRKPSGGVRNTKQDQNVVRLRDRKKANNG